MIEYYKFIIAPFMLERWPKAKDDNIYAAMDNIIVAMWSGSRWIDQGVYRRLSVHGSNKTSSGGGYEKTTWDGPPYEASMLGCMEVFEEEKAKDLAKLMKHP